MSSVIRATALAEALYTAALKAGAKPVPEDAAARESEDEANDDFWDGGKPEPTRSDFVEAVIVDQTPIPPGSNPFDYDLGNMCSTLVCGWVVMHPGYGNHEGTSPLNYVILVNTVSGQRIRIDLVPTPKET